MTLVMITQLGHTAQEGVLLVLFRDGASTSGFLARQCRQSCAALRSTASFSPSLFFYSHYTASGSPLLRVTLFTIDCALLSPPSAYNSSLAGANRLCGVGGLEDSSMDKKSCTISAAAMPVISAAHGGTRGYEGVQ